MIDYSKIVADVGPPEGFVPDTALSPDPAPSGRAVDHPGIGSSPSFDPKAPIDIAGLEAQLNEGLDPSAPAPEAPPLPRAPREYLPLNHEKYQGIAEAKGYAQGDDFSGNRLKRVHYSHEAMIDVMIAEPTITQTELAKRFGRTQSWISIVIGSDAFQAALAKRRDDLTDPFLIATIEERFRGLAQQSLQVIARKLEETQNADLALKALDISSKALGFGARNPSTTNVQANFVVQLPSKIPDAADWAAAHSGPGPVIENRP